MSVYPTSRMPASVVKSMQVNDGDAAYPDVPVPIVLWPQDGATGLNRLLGLNVTMEEPQGVLVTSTEIQVTTQPDGQGTLLTSSVVNGAAGLLTIVGGTLLSLSTQYIRVRYVGPTGAGPWTQVSITTLL